MLQKQQTEISELRERTLAELSGVGKRNRKKKKAIWEKSNKAEEAIKQRCAEELEAFEPKDLAAAEATLTAGDSSAASGEQKRTDSGTKIVAGEQKSKKGRSQRRRAKKEAEKLELDKQRAVERTEAADHSDRKIEIVKLQTLLRREQLSMKEIASDGHCLYRAVSDQLTQLGDTKAATKGAHLELRRVAANYMRRHAADFLPFLPVADGQAPKEVFAAHCDSVETTADWGGQLELRALAQALRRPILVYSADAPVVRMGETYQGQALRVTFHLYYYALGEHYNSVVPLR